MDVDAVKARVRRVWDMGDYSYLSKRLEPASHELCDACAVSAGQEVLDVAAGDGNFALACAREGASVVASDFAPGMVARGRARSEEEGCSIEWVEADAEELPFEDGRFDCAGSVFGMMIAPRPERVAQRAVSRGASRQHRGTDRLGPEWHVRRAVCRSAGASRPCPRACRTPRTGATKRSCASA